MKSDFASARIFTNMQGLADLKLAAKNEDTGSLEEAAKQFESLFLHMMLKTMREANVNSSLFGSDQMQFHQEMFDQQLAINLGARQSLGIADMLIRQVGQQPDVSTEQNPFNEMVPVNSRLSENISKIKDPSTQKPVRFESPKEYIEFMRPLAEKFAPELGVDADVLIAQSALETGWGKKIISDEAGESSHNLFGIKARKDWHGPSARVNTLEFIDGTMKKTRDTFRMYDSFADSFKDYAALITSNPGYSDAITKSRNSNEYIKALQMAGYATDPEYANKVIDIMDRHSI